VPGLACEKDTHTVGFWLLRLGGNAKRKEQSGNQYCGFAISDCEF
jgi:hypothetical protein